MEESYQFAVKRETLHNIQAYTHEIKHVIAFHVDAFQGKFIYNGGQARAELTWNCFLCIV